MKNKLVRIHTDDEAGVFDCNFSTPINLKPNAEVALKSCKFSRGAIGFEITSLNDDFQFQVDDTDADGNGGLHDVTLSRRTVERDKFSELTQEMEDRCNDSIGVLNNVEQGSSVRVNLDKNNKVHFNVNRFGALYVPYLNPLSQRGGDDATNDKHLLNPSIQGVKNLVISVTENTDGDDWHWTMSATAANADVNAMNKQWFMHGLPFSEGGGAVYMTLNHFANVDAGVSAGAFIGLLDARKEGKLRSVAGADPTIQVSDFAFHLASSNVSTQPYEFFVNSATPSQDHDITPFKTDQPIPANKDADILCDVMSLRLNKGNIEAVIYRSNGVGNAYTTKVIGSARYPRATDNNFEEQPLFLLVSGVRGEVATTQVTNIFFTPDAFESADPRNYYETGDVSFTNDPSILNKKTENILGAPHLSAIPYPAAPGRDTPFNANLVFGSQNLMLRLGYTALEQNPTAIVQPSFSFVALHSMSRFLGTNAFLFQLLNLNVESYDSMNPQNQDISSMGGRQNILEAGMINDADGGNEEVGHAPNELTFLDLNNAQPLAIRNIKARIINDDYHTLEMIGLSEAVLIFRDE